MPFLGKDKFSIKNHLIWECCFSMSYCQWIAEKYNTFHVFKPIWNMRTCTFISGTKQSVFILATTWIGPRRPYESFTLSQVSIHEVLENDLYYMEVGLATYIQESHLFKEFYNHYRCFSIKLNEHVQRNHMCETNHHQNTSMQRLTY